jgi:dihydrofolate synthase / folylpolyglutamate synthase
VGCFLSGYRSALDYLFARTTGVWKFGLERVEALLRELGDPHHRFQSLHVAGTNGKGSVVATLDALLRSAGRGGRPAPRVGRYTSPHLIDFRERFLIDGVPVGEDAITEFIDQWTPAVERIGATFFEATTAMAFDLFARAGVDIAVVETGLGGRLDATNVLSPLGAAVTVIDIDHVEYLGDTREAIAKEKAGIFKPGVPAVIGEPEAGIRALLVGEARARGARPVRAIADELTLADIVVGAEGTTFTTAGPMGRARLTTPLAGRHQAGNAMVALTLLDAVGSPWTVPLAEAGPALRRVALPGRFQRMGKFILEVAHNPSGIDVFVETLRTVAPPRPVVCLLCVLADKDWRGIMADLAPMVSHFILTDAPTAPASRSWDVAEAKAFLDERGWSGEAIPDFERALAAADAAGATVVVTGSFHTVGDAMARLQVSPLGG